MPRFAEPVVTLIVILCTNIAMLAGCSCQSRQPPRGSSVSMYVGAVRAGDDRIAVTCSFANMEEHPLLIGDNIDIGWHARTPDGFESESAETSRRTKPGTYILLPVIPLDRRHSNTFVDEETISRQVMIRAPYGVDRVLGVLEVSAELEFLHYDIQTKRLEPRRETVTRIAELIEETRQQQSEKCEKDR